MSNETRTAEEIAQDYEAMGHSKDLINDIVAGNQDDLEAEERQTIVDRNVAHLELMVALTDWGSEDMTDINAAITSGNGYTAA